MQQLMKAHTHSSIDSNHGYTLVEMALVIAVLGVLSGMMLTMLTGTQEAATLKAQKAQMKAVDEALVYHVRLRGRLPCPARPTLLESDANFGREDCSSPADIATVRDSGGGTSANEDVYIGMLPTRTLNISDRFLYDQWGQRLTYAVIKKLTTDATSFQNYATTINRGVIRINDAAGNQMTAQSPTAVVAYAVISHGKDKKGAYTQLGTAPINCGTTEIDRENCLKDNPTFIDADINDSDITANYYYDFIRWRDLALLKDSAGFTQECKIAPTISAGLNSYIVAGTGNLYAWGENTNSSFGNGTSVGSTTAQVIGTNTDWTMIGSSGVNYACGIRAGSLLCWGDRGNGKVGDGGAVAGDQSTPVPVSGGFSDWTHVAGGNGHICGVRSTGLAYCWGDNSNYELGDGTNVAKNVPTLVLGGFTDWKKTGSGSRSTCGIRSSGLMYCWGDNPAGQLGNGAMGGTSGAPVPTIDGFTDWTEIMGSSWTHCGLRANGRAYCWGGNANGQVGDGTTSNRHTATEVSGLHTDWKSISLGAEAACGLRGTGNAWCWGFNTYGQLGDGTTTNRTTPVQVSGAFTDWAAIDTNPGSVNYNTCGLRKNGNFYCWGGNNAGQVGDGTTTQRTSPVQVLGVTTCFP